MRLLGRASSTFLRIYVRRDRLLDNLGQSSCPPGSRVSARREPRTALQGVPGRAREPPPTRHRREMSGRQWIAPLPMSSSPKRRR